MKTFMLILLAALATVLCAASLVTAAASTCPWRTVSNIDYKYVQNFGRWAVDQQNAHLNFHKVESATAQAVGDCLNDMNRNYALNILASRRNGAGDDKFKAVVYVEREIVPDYSGIPICRVRYPKMFN
ncbi:hypothetical protein EJB05_02842, partial [Eragrostis curvula]